MTNEEMERGIEFLLKSQAGFDAKLSKTSEQVEKLVGQVEKLTGSVETLTQTHEEFTRFVRGHMEAQSELNQSLRETVRALTLAQARTDERLSDLESSGSQA